MDVFYSYNKVRKNFGAQPMFCETPSVLLDSISPSVAEQKKYILRNPVHQHSQASLCWSEHYINTRRVDVADRGANHAEGGWPKDVNFFDEEATSRYRRRIERDDTFIDAVFKTYPRFEHCIKQNNSIEMYQMYFKGMHTENQVEKSQVRISNVYSDPYSRPIASIDWTPDDNSKLVVAYCDKRYPFLGPLGPFNHKNVCYIWEVETPYSPSIAIDPPSACWQLVCNPVNSTMLLGGLEDGRVCIFDIRTQREPVIISETHLAHRWPVSTLVFLQTRLNNEFFSSSSDGRCMWWDTRNISEPTESLIMSCRPPPGETMSMSNAEPVSILSFERTLPTKFLCGTDTGLVVNVNRKGKTFGEIMSSVFYAHSGPVRALYRSPGTTKVFITCGDWSIHIWSDDCNSPIITGEKQKYVINDVVWAPQRYSGYMSVSSDGKFRYYDLLRTYREPVLSLLVSKSELLKIKPHDEGKMIATGNNKGAVFLLGLSDNLVSSTGQDKQLMGQIFERESKREHILETRLKEIRLKLLTDEAPPPAVVAEYDEAVALKSAEDDYRKIVSDEAKRAGVTPSSAKDGKLRKR